MSHPVARLAGALAISILSLAAAAAPRTAAPCEVTDPM